MNFYGVSRLRYCHPVIVIVIDDNFSFPRIPSRLAFVQENPSEIESPRFSDSTEIFMSIALHRAESTDPQTCFKILHFPA